MGFNIQLLVATVSLSTCSTLIFPYLPPSHESSHTDRPIHPRLTSIVQYIVHIFRDLNIHKSLPWLLQLQEDALRAKMPSSRALRGECANLFPIMTSRSISDTVEVIKAKHHISLISYFLFSKDKYFGNSIFPTTCTLVHAFRI